MTTKRKDVLIRRTITIDPEVNEWIQNYRGERMLETNKDYTYTEAVMMLCKKAITLGDSRQHD